MLEFALAAPIFFFLMFGLIEAGRAVYYTQVLDSAARDGARYGVVHGFRSAAAGGCPSGPMPNGATNFCDPDGTRDLIPAVKARAVGVTDKASALIVHVKWCDATKYQADPPVSQCYDWLQCSEWTTASDLSPDTGGLGDGDNNRGQIVTVCVQYSYKSLLAGYLPLPDFTVSGRATLVVNN
jgi:TadE-like protein